MKKRTLIQIFAGLLLVTGRAAPAVAQDIHFSQFFESATMRNPALTGIFSGDYRVTANYRSQWGAFAVPYQTSLLSAETRIMVNRSTGDCLSFGLTAAYDKAGSLDFTGISVYGAVNYNKALGDAGSSYLSVGMCAGYLQRSFDASKARFASQFASGVYSSSNPTGENLDFGAIRHYDVSAGVSLNGSLGANVNYYLGAAGYHISKPQESYYAAALIRLTTRWSGNAGLAASLGNDYGVTAHLNYQNQQPYQELIAGILINHDFQARNGGSLNLATGCFYRVGDAIIPMVQARRDPWTLTFSYDVANNQKRLYLQGSAGYEVSLSYRGRYNHQRPTNVQCPRFEQGGQDAIF